MRGVNFQPVSLVGKISKADRMKMRITIPDAIEKIEEQTGGEVSKEDFYPVPTPYPFTRFTEALTGIPQYDLSAHFACGMGTYVFKDGNKMVPITRFVDVEGLFDYLIKSASDLERGKNKYIVGAKILFRIRSFIDKVLTYEKNPPLTGYAKRASLFGFDLYEPESGEGENCKMDIDSLYIPSQ